MKSIIYGVSFLLAASGAIASFVHVQNEARDALDDLDKRDCTGNNCVRAMISSSALATAFCRTYTTAVVATVGPTFSAQCTQGADQASRACSCQVPPAPTTTPPANCNHNNCLRAMLGKPDDATAFCDTFTVGVQTGTGSWSQCTLGSTQVSSACSCLPTTV